MKTSELALKVQALLPKYSYVCTALNEIRGKSSTWAELSEQEQALLQELWTYRTWRNGEQWKARCAYAVDQHMSFFSDRADRMAALQCVINYFKEKEDAETTP